MRSVSTSQLQCVYPQLGGSKADEYARLLSERLGGGVLSNTCEWAAFLGNVGTESAGLTEWTQVPCDSSDDAPYCGRGPLQLTGRSNFQFCAGQSSCQCPGILDSPSEASSGSIGVGTAACVWQSLSGSSLNRYADGSQSGFLATACTINAGHANCGLPNGWLSRLSYWNKANNCLSGGPGPSPPGPSPPAPNPPGPPPPRPPPGPPSGNCDCSGLSNCLEYGGGKACFSKFNCGSIESEVETCIQYHGGVASCVDKYCSLDEGGDDDYYYDQVRISSRKSSTDQLTASDDVGIAIGVALVIALAIVVGLYVFKSRDGEASSVQQGQNSEVNESLM